MQASKPNMTSSNFQQILTLLILSAFPALTTDLYLASLPSIAAFFGTNVALAQHTLTVYLVAFSISLLFIGPISDRIGRRPIVLLCTVIYLIGSLFAAITDNYFLLLFGRILQAVGAAGGMIMSYAIIRDLYKGPKAAYLLSLIATIMNLFLGLAPALGGQLEATLGWRSAFWVLFGYGMVAILIFYFLLQETQQKLTQHQNKNIKRIEHSIAHPLFIRYAILSSLVFSTYYLYLYIAPFIFIHSYHLAPNQFGLLFIPIVFSYVIGTLTSMYWNKHSTTAHCISSGIALLLMSGVGILLLALAYQDTKHYWLLIFMCISTLGVGLVLPNSIAKALSSVETKYGQSASFLGFAQFICAAAIGTLASLLPFDHVTALAICTLLLAVFAMLCTFKRLIFSALL